MATYYVNKGGNNGNSGADHANAWLTIAYAQTTAGGTTNDLIIGSGAYVGDQAGAGSKFHRGMFADGYVVLDGNNDIASNFDVSSLSGTVTIELKAHTTGGLFVAKRFLTALLVMSTGYGAEDRVEISDVRFENVGLLYWSAGTMASSENLKIWDCEGYGGGTKTFLYSAPNHNFYYHMWNCTLYDYSWVVYANFVSSVYRLSPYRDRGNIYVNNGAIWRLNQGTSSYLTWPGAATDYSDNWYYNNTALHAWNGGSRTTLAEIQSAAGSSRYTQNCNEQDPQLADPAEGNLTLKQSSPIITAAQTGTLVNVTKVGRWKSTYSFSNAYQFSGTWTIASSPAASAGTEWAKESSTGTADVSVNGNGDFEYAGTGTFTMVSPVFDLTSNRDITSFGLIADETYPTEVVDSGIADSQPNRKRIEYRAQTAAQGSFNQNTSSGTLAWTEYEIGVEPTGAAIVSCRYIQLRLVFRDDGVAA